MKPDLSIPYKVIYSSRRTLAISIARDASVTVRAPYRTALKSITKFVNDKSDWILKHTDRLKEAALERPKRLYVDGEIHLFRGTGLVLEINRSAKPYCRFCSGSIELGTPQPDNCDMSRRILYAGYRREARTIFKEVLDQVLNEKSSYGFRISKLNIRTMKSRWGSCCSSKGVISLNTELIRLPERFTRYVILHELSHLRHNNHGAGFYGLLAELYPEWSIARKELRGYNLRE